jgi:hypothetical protein
LPSHDETLRQLNNKVYTKSNTSQSGIKRSLGLLLAQISDLCLNVIYLKYPLSSNLSNAKHWSESSANGVCVGIGLKFYLAK